MPARAASTSPMSLRDLTVADAMTSGVITCAAAWPLRDVAAVMGSNRVHCVVVPDLEREPPGWGVVSDGDLMEALTAGDLTLTAGTIAASDPVTVSAREPLERACQLMAEHAVSHVLVIEHTSAWPVGVVSSLDVARAAARLAAPLGG